MRSSVEKFYPIAWVCSSGPPFVIPSWRCPLARFWVGILCANCLCCQSDRLSNAKAVESRRLNLDNVQPRVHMCHMWCVCARTHVYVATGEDTNTFFCVLFLPAFFFFWYLLEFFFSFLHSPNFPLKPKFLSVFIIFFYNFSQKIGRFRTRMVPKISGWSQNFIKLSLKIPSNSLYVPFRCVFPPFFLLHHVRFSLFFVKKSANGCIITCTACIVAQQRG